MDNTRVYLQIILGPSSCYDDPSPESNSFADLKVTDHGRMRTTLVDTTKIEHPLQLPGAHNNQRGHYDKQENRQ